MTKSDSYKDFVDFNYEYECPSIRDRGISYSSSDEEDFNSAMNYCSEKHDGTRFKEYNATAPNNADKFVVGASSPDIRRNSIGSITPFQTDTFSLTCRSLPDNNRHRNNSLFSNELKVLNKVGSSYKIQKNVESASSNNSRRMTSSLGTYNTPYQSSLKGERIHSTLSTGSRASMHFSRHF